MNGPVDSSQTDDGRLDVVAVGSALVDVVARVEENVIGRAQLVKSTMELTDLDRSRRIYDLLGPAVESSGGSAANTAAGVAALGGKVGYVGKVAADGFGAIFAHDLAAMGVELAGSMLVPPTGHLDAVAEEVVGGEMGEDVGTGRCLVLVTPDGERTMATHLGVASTLDVQDIDEALVARAEILYLEGYLWDLAPAKQAMRRAIEVAHGAEGAVALTVSDPFCVGRHRADFLELLEGEIDILFANEEEALMLFGETSLDRAIDAARETGLLVALTRGAAGSVIIGPQGWVEVPAVRVRSVVDTTGAGDLYAAGFLYGLTHGGDPEDAARLGSLCAAEIVSHLGARPEDDLRRLVDR
ncbi:MAG: adenosine kinase [Acidimicrobiales bacterium]